jgi:hypothetical protein
MAGGGVPTIAERKRRQDGRTVGFIVLGDELSSYRRN